MEIILKSFNIWREKHLSARQFLLLLAFLAGIGAALAAQFLKWLISEIEFLLTYQFDSLLSMSSKTTLGTVSRRFFMPSVGSADTLGSTTVGRVSLLQV